jgi:hypothetical protein
MMANKHCKGVGGRVFYILMRLASDRTVSLLLVYWGYPVPFYCPSIYNLASVAFANYRGTDSNLYEFARQFFFCRGPKRMQLGVWITGILYVMVQYDVWVSLKLWCGYPSIAFVGNIARAVRAFFG